MLKRAAVVIAWIVATFATATITLAAVGRAGSEVSERPAMPISSAELAARFATTTTSGPAGTTAPSVATTDPASTIPTTTGAPTTTQVPATTTTAVPSTTTTTTAGQTTTYEQPGVGRVTIRIAKPDVTYENSLILGSGYHVEVEGHGPEEVVVKFESEDEEYTFTARFEGGTLKAGFSSDGDDD